MYRHIKELFDDVLSDLHVDTELCKEIIRQDKEFLTKNEQHSEFFGSALLGVNKVVWGNQEQADWIEVVLGTDALVLKNAISTLPSEINPKDPKTGKPLKKVAMNPINLSMVYMAHRVRISNVPRKLKEDTLKSIFRIMHYKFATSLLVNYFQSFTPDSLVAYTAFNSLNNRFDLKVAGNWNTLFQMRAEELAGTGPKKSIHYDTYGEKLRSTLEYDNKYLYIITDVQTRIRRLIVKYFSVLDSVYKSKDAVRKSSALMDTDEGHMVRDVVVEKNNYLRYLRSTMDDKRNFIKEELTFPITEKNSSINYDKFNNILEYVVKNRNKPEVVELCDRTLTFAFQHMRDKSIRVSDLETLTDSLKNMFIGSKVFDKDILRLRKMGDEIAKKGAHYSKTASVSTERTGLLLYIVLRSLTKNYFSL